MKTAYWIAFGLALAGCGRPPAEPEKQPAMEQKAPGTVRLAEPVQKEAGIATETARLTETVGGFEATGRITVNESAAWRVGSVVEGRVARMNVAVGDRVAAGQVMARLHSHDVHEQRAEVQKIKTEIGRLESRATVSQRMRDRAKRLLDLSAGSVEQLEHAETELKNVQAELAKSRMDLERTRIHLVETLGLEADEPEHHKPGEHAGDDDLVPVKSPAAGTVIERLVTIGSVVVAGTPVCTVADLSTVWMMASVPEEHLARVRPGMMARVTVQAYPGEVFSGKITRLDEFLDAETRTAQARVELANPRGRLKPEMYARAEIAHGGSRPVMMLPHEALQDVRGVPTVFVRKAADTFEARPVEAGKVNGERVEIVAGLKPGEVVAVKGTFILKSELLRATLAEE
ncbi:MAG: efflux RND transporter periplasmic adaptor subunit [Acidobacteria bacterium]|nr:efflux RND transporter periplasmic adaptor subunit [Acidobacteriota bacterium]